MMAEKTGDAAGRGYNEQIWIKGVLQIASDAKLQIVEGPFQTLAPMPAPARICRTGITSYCARCACRTSRLVHLLPAWPTKSPDMRPPRSPWRKLGC